MYRNMSLPQPRDMIVCVHSLVYLIIQHMDAISIGLIVAAVPAGHDGMCEFFCAALTYH